MITAQIQNMQQVIDGYRGLADDQIPFAAALSLTSTAKLSQKAVWGILPMRFTIRRLQWAKQGIRITAATKQELAAIVEDIHEYMQLQEASGDKVPRYGQYIAIPLSGARKSQSALVADGDKPAAVMASGMGFIRGNVMYRSYFARSKSRRGFKGVGGFSSGSWSRQIVPMYALVHSAWIPKRYGFEELVRQVVSAHWEEEFHKAFDRAMASRRVD